MKKILAACAIAFTLVSTTGFTQVTKKSSLGTISYATTVCQKRLFSGKTVYIVVKGYRCPIGWSRAY